MKHLKRLAMALYPSPRGIGSIGPGSVVLLPRRVRGAAHVHLGLDVIVQQNSWIEGVECYMGRYFAPEVRIGDGCRIGRNVILTAIERVTLSEGCLLSEQVFISDHTHQAIPGPPPPQRQPLIPLGPVFVGKHCFIGIRACILGGVTLGDYCIVGANSVVTRSFPAGSVIAGAPARLLRTLPIATVSPQERKEIAPDSL